MSTSDLRRFEQRMFNTLEAVWRSGGRVTQIKLSPSDYALLRNQLDPQGVPVFADPFFGHVPIVEDVRVPSGIAYATEAA